MHIGLREEALARPRLHAPRDGELERPAAVLAERIVRLALCVRRLLIADGSRRAKPPTTRRGAGETVAVPGSARSSQQRPAPPPVTKPWSPGAARHGSVPSPVPQRRHPPPTGRAAGRWRPGPATRPRAVMGGPGAAWPASRHEVATVNRAAASARRSRMSRGREAARAVSALFACVPASSTGLVAGCTLQLFASPQITAAWTSGSDTWPAWACRPQRSAPERFASGADPIHRRGEAPEQQARLVASVVRPQGPLDADAPAPCRESRASSLSPAPQHGWLPRTFNGDGRGNIRAPPLPPGGAGAPAVSRCFHHAESTASKG